MFHTIFYKLLFISSGIILISLIKSSYFSFAAKSPVFGMINSTIAGLSTVRSSDSQNRLIKMFDDAQVSKVAVLEFSFVQFSYKKSCVKVVKERFC